MTMPAFDAPVGKTASAADLSTLRDRPRARDRLTEAVRDEIPEAVHAIPNGPAAAAILAAGIGCFAVGLFATAGDAWPAVAKFFTFYRPTGALSGVTTSAIVVWLVVWYALSRRWGRKAVALGKVNLAAFVFLALGVLLTFPPFMDLVQGK
jgi:hypothetical protein